MRREEGTYADLEVVNVFAFVVVLIGGVPGVSGAEPSEPDAPVANDSDFPNITYKRFFLSEENPNYPIKLEVYKPAGTPPLGGFPGVIVIHGGAWKDGDKLSENAEDTALYLKGRGLAAFSINYRLTCEPPPAPPPVSVGDPNLCLDTGHGPREK